MNATAAESRRNLLVPSLLTLAGVLVVWVVFAELWTDKLWFDSVAYPQVFTTQLWAQVVLFAAFFVSMAAMVGGNMWIAYRLRPVVRRGGQSNLLDRYRALLEKNVWLAILVPSVFLGFMAGAGGASQSLKYLAWLNRQPFGVADPYFNADVSFYVFDYPVFSELLGFAMSATVFALIAASAVHFTTGGLAIGRVRTAAEARPARLHLSILAGVILVLYGFNQLLGRYGVLLEQGTLLTGMQYTDDHARVGAKVVIAAIAFLVGALFFTNGFLRRNTLPLAGVILMIISGVILGLIYPAVVRSFQVLPNEPDKERPYIQANIEATRTAFGLTNTEVADYNAVVQTRPGQLKEDAEALPGIRLIDPAVVPDSFDQLQQVKNYYAFQNILDVDRYMINGVESDVVVAARELDQSKLPDKSWNNLHTVYTHGYGLVGAYGNKRSGSGDPVWIGGDLPPNDEFGKYEGRIYFGENSSTYAIVGREAGQAPIELDTPGGSTSGQETYNTYAGAGGVPIGDMFTRLLYATHFMDLNMLLSDRVNSASQVLYQRTPKERVAAVAPWLTLDSNTYPAVVNSRLVWIVDGYTVSENYPNSQTQSLQDATTDTQSSLLGSQADANLNYLRNSVKAVVDATDGTVSLYAWDSADPILAAYSAAFPGSIKPKEAISPELLAHLRYPGDLFKVQRQVLSRYHMTDANAWYQQSDLWQVPADPTKQTSGQAQTTSGVAEPPYYLSIKWPGDDAAVFSQTAVFVPKGRSNLASYLSVVAEATSPNYGKLRVLRMSATHQVDGPGQTFNAMTTDNRFAELLRNYTNQGSAEARYGNLLTLPMGSGLLYVMPIYTARQGSTGSYPALRFVAVRFGEKVGIGETLQEALDQVFAGDAGASTGEGGQTPTTPTTPTTPDQPGSTDSAGAAADLKKAQTAFDAADAALRKGDLAEYQKQIGVAKQAIAAALKKLGR
ncbi:UPF0182 family protein [Propionicimonas sp.]|uniref:UPF0182 family membrane protein n=1 Tax=Propionicimonas sp. TaxID=1955623 RepID=UPI001821E300|nr:UPF0182 family protein [Propionicimonas sp.]MBU3977509.1 UPF0182 family protein [Actinomycetota bacterium]MBA3021435.1 UPF0182 family protein [Propionicimonas sp.]MBU3986019.1 UPF0182 family protein [Actinomycetota bacterium]MBU4008804.1 UPF0182 family protein [Actinomycetota bacterium]MBU4066046.1 UPF0182 family protein [Actinomycetota bacterium]